MKCEYCNGTGYVPIQFSPMLDGFCPYCNGTEILKDVATIKAVNNGRVSTDEYKKQMENSSTDAKLCRDVYMNLKEGK